MATLNTTNIKHASSGSNNIVLSADGSCTFPNTSTGKILQVVQTFKKDAFSTTTNNNTVEITGLNASIAKTVASSKILIMVDIGYGRSGRDSTHFNLYEDSSELTEANGTGATTNRFISDYKHLYDTTSESYSWHNVSKKILIDGQNDTNSHTYKVYVKSGAITFYLNRRDYSYSDSSTSSITLMEVAA